MTIPSAKGPTNQKSPLLREELDDGAICLNPVQQLSAAVQEDFLHPIGQKMPLTLCIRGQALMPYASVDRHDDHSPLIG